MELEGRCECEMLAFDAIDHTEADMPAIDHVRHQLS
jgi:hypothetical protein